MARMALLAMFITEIFLLSSEIASMANEAIFRSLPTIQCFPNLLGRYFAKAMSFSLTRQRTKQLASVLNCGNYPKNQLSQDCIRYRRDLGSPLGLATWGTTLIPMHTTDSFFL